MKSAAQPRPTAEHFCNGHTIYATKAEALRRLARMRFKHRRGVGPLQPYRCRDCGGFHLGSNRR